MVGPLSFVQQGVIGLTRQSPSLPSKEGILWLSVASVVLPVRERGLLALCLAE